MSITLLLYLLLGKTSSSHPGPSPPRHPAIIPRSCAVLFALSTSLLFTGSPTFETDAYMFGLAVLQLPERQGNRATGAFDLIHRSFLFHGAPQSYHWTGGISRLPTAMYVLGTRLKYLSIAHSHLFVKNFSVFIIISRDSLRSLTLILFKPRSISQRCVYSPLLAPYSPPPVLEPTRYRSTMHRTSMDDPSLTLKTENITCRRLYLA